MYAHFSEFGYDFESDMKSVSSWGYFPDLLGSLAIVSTNVMNFFSSTFTRKYFVENISTYLRCKNI